MAVTRTTTTVLGTGTFDPGRNGPQWPWDWTPSPAFASDLNNDPANLGYKVDGVFKSSAAIAALLTSPLGTVANPVAQPNVPKPFTIMDVAGAAPNTLKALADADLQPIADAINRQDSVGVQRWADILLLRSAMSQAEHDAVYALVTATHPDPAWQATVPGPSRLEQVFSVGSVESSLIFQVTGVA